MFKEGTRDQKIESDLFDKEKLEKTLHYKRCLEVFKRLYVIIESNDDVSEKEKGKVEICAEVAKKKFIEYGLSLADEFFKEEKIEEIPEFSELFK